MSKRDLKEDIDEILSPQFKNPERIQREVKLQHTGKQFTIQIPIAVANALNLEKGDIFIFDIPLKNKEKYSIKLKNKRF